MKRWHAYQSFTVGQNHTFSFRLSFRARAAILLILLGFQLLHVSANDELVPGVTVLGIIIVTVEFFVLAGLVYRRNWEVRNNRGNERTGWGCRKTEVKHRESVTQL